MADCSQLITLLTMYFSPLTKQETRVRASYPVCEIKQQLIPFFLYSRTPKLLKKAISISLRKFTLKHSIFIIYFPFFVPNLKQMVPACTFPFLVKGIINHKNSIVSFQKYIQSIYCSRYSMIICQYNCCIIISGLRGTIILNNSLTIRLFMKQQYKKLRKNFNIAIFCQINSCQSRKRPLRFRTYNTPLNYVC